MDKSNPACPSDAAVTSQPGYGYNAPQGPAPGYAGGPAPGYAGGPAPGYAGGPAPGYAGGPAPGYAGGPAPGYSTQHTTVVVQQPGVMQVAGPRLWSTDLCGCFEDIGICLYGTFCGCCMAMGLATDMGESACVPLCVPGALIVMRTKMRLTNNIQGTIMDDCCTVACCGHCALCQMAREMDIVRNNVMPR